MKYYIIVMRHTRMHIVGPFDTQEQAALWGAGNNPDDDPRWQIISFEPGRVLGGQLAVPVHPPSYMGLGALMRSKPGVDNA